ncbi:MAG TPA: efflux RND transporter permease subunit, partial [Pirellulaceae bacterium]|nr:efflux RND transporter permease subunit [Pirellulaceae bacterium]
MIERVIEWSIRNRFLVMFLAAGLSLLGVYAVFQTPMDATPDLSENQVIVFADWMGRSPREIEDQITYPLSRKLQGLAGVKAVRSSSEFNFSMITIIFEDGVDFYFARQRVTEKLAQAGTFLPAGVIPYLAPDATALGQIFWYTVEPSPQQPIEPGRLWAINKFYIAPQLNAAAGVADVAVVGGTPLEYQIDVRPEDLRTYDVTLGEVYAAVARSNMPSGGGVIQKNNAEYIIRGIGWIRDLRDIEETVIREIGGVPLLVKNVATVQLGPQFRRSVFEKNGNEVTGGAVLMRHGQNPLAVTQAVKDKILELQPGLPPGVHIAAAYDRTRLIHGAIHTLTEVMWHEMLIASIAILLILMHVRSVFVICVTLPLAVLFSFLLMWLLRVLGVIDIQANIMSLAGITISIGILVDQAIVMTENATHHLKEHFGDRQVTGDTRELVIPACRTVGRPIFFSVLIMLISFIPVFMLSGREGKYFHPLAFTKSFALIGVALISVTLVPALIPSFIRGRLKSEEENWIVRSLIQIYKPLLTWALPRRNLVMWFFAAMLIVAAGIFPLQAIFGYGASEPAWRICFLIAFALVTALTVVFTAGWQWQALSLATLILLGLWSYHFPKIGVAFMPALDEGTTLEMPITVPRASVTQAADDLKARDALLRGFPEVESVIGKAGRADTPTDPAPLDMVETFVNFRPRELWPRRVLRYPDAAWQVERVLDRLIADGFIAPPAADDRRNLVNDATQKAIERFDETQRELALRRYVEFENELESKLTRFAVGETLRLIRRGMKVKLATPAAEEAVVDRLAGELTPKLGPWLSRQPTLVDAVRLSEELVRLLKERSAIPPDADALQLHETGPAAVFSVARDLVGVRQKTLAGELLASIERERDERWREHVRHVNWELFDHGVESFTWYALEETVRAAQSASLLAKAARGAEAQRFAAAALAVQLGRQGNAADVAPFQSLRETLEAPMRKRVFFWPRSHGTKGDLVDDEMSRVLQVPGWSNIFTQPIINRIEMLSTGVRTDIGVKVFGSDLETIDRVGKEIEAVLRPIRGAKDVVAAPIMGKGYIDIQIDRAAAARYGISVEDVQTEIEMALAGRAVTFTVEKRDRFPVRVRYARSSREDEESVRRLLISPQGMSAVTTTSMAPPH